MSKHIKQISEKVTVPALQKMYQLGEKITMVTAYDYITGLWADRAKADMILVGDSLGMVVQGKKDTLTVEIEDLIYHTRCVAQAITTSHLMADMPFMSYQVSYEDAVKNAGLLIKAGAESVKIEGGEEMADLVWYLGKIGIPVMAHIGLRPQSIHMMGGYKVQGKTKKEADSLLEDAKILEEAGAFSLLLEGVPIEVAEEITRKVTIPTIGIGSGPNVSGQVLVIHDILGSNPDFKPRFVKQYANLFDVAQNAIGEYVREVKEAQFPTENHGVHRNLVEVKGKKG